MIDRVEFFKTLNEVRKDQIVVVGLGRSARDWYAVTRDETTFYMNSSMGMASSFCLGLSLALPHRRILGIEGDGSIAMNLGSLLTLGANQSCNFLHIIMCNRMYESSGGQPLVDHKNLDFVKIARGCGIEHAYSFDDLSELRGEMDRLLALSTYTLVSLEIEPSARPPAPGERTVMSQPVEMTYKFLRHIEKIENKEILA